MHYGALIYIGACLLIGMFGANKRMGFWGYFFASLALTPILGLLLLIISGPRRT
jgi:hypothetical protein